MDSTKQTIEYKHCLRWLKANPSSLPLCDAFKTMIFDALEQAAQEPAPADMERALEAFIYVTNKATRTDDDKFLLSVPARLFHVITAALKRSAENERLREALEFYADYQAIVTVQKQVFVHITNEGRGEYEMQIVDKGDVAREALSDTAPPSGEV